MSAITLENVSLSFAARPQPFTVLEDISLSLNKGEFVVLLGPSGCGKSTILNLVAGFTQPDRGRVAAGGKPVRAPGPDRGMIFQQPNLFPWLSVLDNVTFGPRLGKYRKQETNARALDWLGRVGLKGFEHHAPWQLSGGMKQRVALARAWLPGPEVLLLDEPFGALDAQTRLMMQELLRGLAFDRHHAAVRDARCRRGAVSRRPHSDYVSETGKNCRRDYPALRPRTGYRNPGGTPALQRD